MTITCVLAISAMTDYPIMETYSSLKTSSTVATTSTTGANATADYCAPPTCTDIRFSVLPRGT